MTALVLVHGAWHGGWCWSRVEAHLAASGVDEVVTPTLTGLGDRRHELTPRVGLRTHVDDVTALLDAVDQPVVRVGHSYAGLVVREAADRRPHAVSRLVLVDGWAGPDGTNLLGLAPAWMADAVTTAATEGDGWRIPPPDPVLVGVDDPADADLLRARLTHQPLLSFTEPTRLTGAVDAIPTTAVVAEPRVLPFGRFADEAGWATTAIAAGHDLMLTAPAALAAALVRAVEPASP